MVLSPFGETMGVSLLWLFVLGVFSFMKPQLKVVQPLLDFNIE